MMMMTLRRTCAAAAFFALTTPATAFAQSTFTSFSDFVAAAGTVGIDSFDDLGDLEVSPGPLSRSAGANDYSVQSTAADPLNSLFSFGSASDIDDIWLSTEDASVSLLFNGFGSNVFAIGGRFFATDQFGGVSGTSVRVVARDVMDNEIDVSLAPTSPDAFFGIRFAHAVASLTLTADNGGFSGDPFYATVNDLVLGATPRAVPEPAAVWLLVAGAATLLVVCRRQRA